MTLESNVCSVYKYHFFSPSIIIISIIFLSLQRETERREQKKKITTRVHQSVGSCGGQMVANKSHTRLQYCHGLAVGAETGLSFCVLYVCE